MSPILEGLRSSVHPLLASQSYSLSTMPMATPDTNWTEESGKEWEGGDEEDSLVPEALNLRVPSTWKRNRLCSRGELGPRGHVHKVAAELGDGLIYFCIWMVLSGKALVLGTLKMLSRKRGGALDTAVVGQAETPALLALEQVKRGLGTKGSSLTNWAPSEQCGGVVAS